MDKKAGLFLPEADDMPTIGRHLLGGAATGGGAAALLSLIHYIRLQKKLSDEQRKIQNPTDTDENTIVLTLPPKRATDEKRANDPATFALSYLAAIGGGAGMYQLVRKLYHAKLMKEIKAKEDAARTELLDQLTAPKVAEATKEAAGTFSYVDAPLGMALLLALLGTGATGYVTKQIMDEKFRQVDRDKYEPPKVTRVLFRSAQPKPEELDESEKAASDDDMDVLRTAVVLHMVKLSGDLSVFDNPDVQAAMQAASLSKEAVLGLTDKPELSGLLSQLLQQKGLRRSIQSAYMQDHPVLKHFKWALKVPGLSNIADAITYGKLGLKQAMFGMPTSSGITNSLIGSLMAEHAVKDDKDAVPPVQEDPEAMVDKIQLSGTDDLSKAFLEQKRERIKQLLLELAATQRK